MSNIGDMLVDVKGLKSVHDSIKNTFSTKQELTNVDSKFSEVNSARQSGNGTTYNNLKARLDADKEAIETDIGELKADLGEQLNLSKNTLAIPWESGSITMNGTKTNSAANMRSAYIVRLKKGGRISCKNGAQVRVVTFTMLFPYSTVKDIATDYANEYVASADQYAMLTINSTNTEDAVVVAPYPYDIVDYSTIPENMWIEGSVNTGGVISEYAGRYYTRPFYVGKGSKFECVGNTKFRVICFDSYDVAERKKIDASIDWTGEYTVPQNCFIQIVLATQYDQTHEESLTTSDLVNLHCSLVPAENNDVKIQWELGGVTLATGGDNTSEYRYRTLYFYAKKGDYMQVRSGYTMGVFEYDQIRPQNMRMIIGTAWVTSYTVTHDCICRVSVKKDDGTAVSVSNLVNMLTIITSAKGSRLLNANAQIGVPNSSYISEGIHQSGIWTATYTDVYGWYNALVDSTYVTKETLGNDQSGTYPIYAYRFKPVSVTSAYVNQGGTAGIPIKSRPVKILLLTATHGSERPSILALYNAIYNIVNNWDKSPILEYIRFNCEIVVVPIINPYGFVNVTRGNVNGVDINRNYNTNSWQYGNSATDNAYYRGASAASEAETKLMQNLIMREPFDFVYDFHTHGNFTSYDNMYTWASCGLGYEQLSFEIGEAVTKQTNAVAIKEHGYDADKMIGRNEVYTNFAMIGAFADKFTYASGSPEVAYKLYDGSGSSKNDTELTESVNKVNEEYIINTIIASARTMANMFH